MKQAAELATELQRAERETTAVPRYIEIEEAAHEAGQRLSRRIQSCSIGEVAAGVALHAACPDCGCLCRLSMHKRTLQSTDGPVEVLEPVGYCNSPIDLSEPSAWIAKADMHPNSPQAALFNG